MVSDHQLPLIIGDQAALQDVGIRLLQKEKDLRSPFVLISGKSSNTHKPLRAIPHIFPQGCLRDQLYIKKVYRRKPWFAVEKEGAYRRIMGRSNALSGLSDSRTTRLCCPVHNLATYVRSNALNLSNAFHKINKAGW